MVGHGSNGQKSSYKELALFVQRAHSSAWIEWLPAEQLVEGSSPSEPTTISVLLSGFQHKKGENTRLWNKNDQN